VAAAVFFGVPLVVWAAGLIVSVVSLGLSFAEFADRGDPLVGRIRDSEFLRDIKKWGWKIETSLSARRRIKGCLNAE
jgi:hypothetical protein